MSSKITLVVALFETFTLWVLSIVLVAVPQSASCVNDAQKAVDCNTTYLVNQSVMMFTFSSFFFFSVYQGLFNDNLFDLYAAMFQKCFITAWSIWRFVQPYINRAPDYVFLTVTCSCQLFYFVIAWSLRQEYVWRLYKKAGADKAFRSMYKTYLIWLTFFKLDAAFSIPNVLLAGNGVLNSGWRAGISLTMLVVIIVYLILGYIAVTRESKRLTLVWVALFPLNIAFIIGMWVDQFYFLRTPEAEYSFKTTAFHFFVTGCVTLIVRMVLGFFSYKVYNNFKKGLRKLQYLHQDEDEAHADTGETSAGGDFGYVAYGDDDPSEEGEINVDDVIKATYAKMTRKESDAL